MKAAQTGTLDMSAILLQAYEIGDLINRSEATADYLYWKQQMNLFPEVRDVINKLARAKERFEECQRFGHFHPNYHEAKSAAEAVEAELLQIECVHKFKQSEDRLDELLHTVSSILAQSVSETIKVPGNGSEPDSGCASGGSCGGSCGCG